MKHSTQAVNEAVAKALDAAGFTPSTVRGDQVRLTLTAWQRLTRRLAGPGKD